MRRSSSGPPMGSWCRPMDLPRVMHGFIVLTHGSPMGVPSVCHESMMGGPRVTNKLVALAHWSPMDRPWVTHGSLMSS